MDLCSALSEGTILDSHQLISLYMLSQLLERELDKCQRLVAAIPMDMTAFYGANKERANAHTQADSFPNFALSPVRKGNANAVQGE